MQSPKPRVARSTVVRTEEPMRLVCGNAKSSHTGTRIRFTNIMILRLHRVSLFDSIFQSFVS